MRTHRSLALVVGLLLSMPLLACEEEEEVQQEPAPEIGIMEMPISLRNADPAPNNALRVSISPDAMGADGAHLINLESGRVPEGEMSGGVITKLQEKLRGGGARRAGAITLHVNTPYETTAAVLDTFKQNNINEVAFEVRKPGSAGETGWMVLDNFQVEAEDDEPETFQAGQRRWNELIENWEAVYEACRRDHYVDCDGKPFNPAEGGEMQISLFARGSALKVHFERFGVDPAEDEAAQAAKRGPAMIEGVPSAVPEGEEEDMGPPVVDGTFTWRFRAATDEGLSPITGAFRPLCGAQPCGVVVTGDPDTLSMRLISFLGAAFPNGTEAPITLWEIPEA